jgi:hypothetical protein
MRRVLVMPLPLVDLTAFRPEERTNRLGLNYLSRSTSSLADQKAAEINPAVHLMI